MPLRTLLLPTTPRSRWTAALGAGVALGVSFPPFPLSVLAWVALVPLLGVWQGTDSARQMLLYAYGAFLATFAVAFSWPLNHLRLDTAVLSLNGILALPLLMAIPVALSVHVRRRRDLGWGLVALGSFYLVMEWGMSHGPLAFPWSLLGHTQATNALTRPLAALTGVPGLSAWVLLANGVVFAGLIALRRRRLALLAGLLLIMLPAGYAAWFTTHAPEPADEIQVGFIQPAFSADAWADVHDQRRVDRLLALSDSLLATTSEPPHLLAWPETALPVLEDQADRDALHRRLRAWATARDVPLLTGAITVAPAQEAFQNSALLFAPDSGPMRYDKMKLVPFAEYVPFSRGIAWLRRLAIPAGGVSGYVPGTAQTMLAVPDTTAATNVGVLICFESVFGNYARRYVEQGADVLVTLAQDGWWGRTPGYRQHAAFTRLRAVELQRAVLQVTVSGTSALYLPSGEAAFETGWMERMARIDPVPLYTARSLFARWGDWISPLALLGTVLTAVMAVWDKGRVTNGK